MENNDNRKPLDKTMTQQPNDDNAPATRGDVRAMRSDMEKMEISLRAEMREVSRRDTQELRDEIRADLRALGGRIHILACVIAGSVAAFMLSMFLN